MEHRHCLLCGSHLLLPALLLLLSGLNSFSAEAVLTWSPSFSENIIGYRVYAGNSSGVYDAPIGIGNQKEYTVTGLTDGTWYFAVTAVDIEGNESDYSNEVSKSIRPTTDSTPPVISGISSWIISGTDMRIIWTTNEASNSQIDYGTTTAYGESSELNGTMATTHVQVLSGLPAGALYHFRVKSTDEAGNTAVSGDHTFVTPAPADTTAPVISGVSNSNLTSTGVTIAWMTNEASNSQVEYGSTTGYGRSSTLSGSMVTAHVQALSGLSAGTLYHFRVKSTDVAGNAAASGDYTFTTPAAPDTVPPAISGISCSNLTSTDATITWITDESSDSRVEYGTTTAYDKSSALNASMVTAHTQVLTDLSAGTLYHYRVKSTDAVGNSTVSVDHTFTTAASQDEDSALFAQWLRSDAVQTGIPNGTGSESQTDQINRSPLGAEQQRLDMETVSAFHRKPKTASRWPSGWDRTPPQIMGISSHKITSTDATIVWSTSEASDAQLDYGKTTRYEGGSLAIGSMTKLHSQKLTGLAPQTQYHYRIRSRDAAGNLSISRDMVFTTASNGTAPVIGNVSVSDIAGQSARISWITDKASHSEVEFMAAGEGARRAVLGDFVTQHSITLNNLKKDTSYQFSVRSTDINGNRSWSQEYAFNTLSGSGTVVALPRFFSMQDQYELGEEVFVELALTNLGDQPASLTLSAVDSDGNLITGQGIVNPSRLRVGPQSQSATLEMDLFGEGMELNGSTGWIKVESTELDLDGFALAFGGNLNFADGTGLGSVPLTDFAFTEIEMYGPTRINVANSNLCETALTLELIKADGTARSIQYRTIKANGALVADLYKDIFTDDAPDATNYVRVRSTKGVLSFELMKKTSGDIASLSGQDLTAGGTVLYSPHYVTGGVWKTSFSVINLDSKAGKVQFEFVGENGVQIGTTRTMDIAANGKLYISDPAFFRQPNHSRTYTGYVRIVSDGVRLAASTVFGDRSGTSFSSALPLVSNPQKSVLYGHAVSSDLYRSGIAIINPNDTDAAVEIELCAADGASIEKNREVIPAGRRVAKLFTEYFPLRAGQDQTSGYIRITSDKPLASYSLFGTANLSILSAIPGKSLY